ncbi:family 20 glycosylhydrolase [Marinilongibacter aquaticus]|uniref:family 20 glycosylhydrolase n=1 Tax=Marinilongibacter aquaticus TaxID=2975157 RepID=UPI0021BD0E8B|nr:family 20 glycosylhydrolase [Marinilongibacter aquaticus]UBM60922.1 family 20 glycosylhydrolase [Marinilongibacter aquaticus]
MKKGILTLYFGLVALLGFSQSNYAVKGFAIAVPAKSEMGDFVKFIEGELIPRGVNTLLLRVDYHYQYKSHPELVDEDALSEKDVKAIVMACRKGGIEVIPQINLLGHQSWHSKVSKLLEVYPQFDETPSVKFPEKYEWPNADGLYCKSYCPLHPEVHAVVFELMDEITAVFESKAFHAGLDEVFYIGMDECPRCGGRDKAELFAGEVNKLRNHLAESGKRLWMWGDRLIDGKTTGMGMWEASMNNTYRAVDLIAKDVVICDWHYERADPSMAYFAMKGFDVITCPWRNADIAMKQIELTDLLIEQSTEELKPHYLGIMQTVWSPAGAYMKRFDEKPEDPSKSDVDCFKTVFPK